MKICIRSYYTDHRCVSGSESIPSRSRMNKTKQQLWRSDLTETQVDPPEVDKDGGSVTKRAPESAIWRSCLWQKEHRRDRLT